MATATNKAYGRYPYGLRDIAIADMTGTVADLNAAQTATLEIKTVNNVLRGDDVEKTGVTFIDGGSITFGAGGYSSAAMSIMTGVALDITGTTPNEITTLKIDAGDNMPFFKVYAKILGDSTDDLHILCSKVKLSEGFSLGASDGEFVAPEFTAKIYDDGTNGLVKIVQNETATTLPTS